MAVNGGDSFKIDIDRLVSSIEDMMPHDLVMSSKCCISKTPVILKRHNVRAYIPDAFSIGPLHHGSRNLKATQKIKANYLQRLISRSKSPDTMLRTMVNSIMKVEKEARECYAEAIHYNPEQFVKILVIDGCFLIEFFLKFNNEELVVEGDPIFSRPCMLQCLGHDLILLENQVPWMVLEILFDLIQDSYDTEIFSNLIQDSDDQNILILLAMNFFWHLYFSGGMPPLDQVIKIEDIKHFVELLRKISTLSSTGPQPGQCINIECIKYFVDLFRKLSTSSSFLFGKLSSLSRTLLKISSRKDKEERRRRCEILPSATSLVESGIKFKRGASTQSILDIKFNDGILEIPPFEIGEITETFFRNLISYEQCHTFGDDKITSYAILLDSLINTAKDIDILCENKIINNWLNPEDAAQLFNKLYHDTGVTGYKYAHLCWQVKDHCEHRWPKWRAVLVRNYFNTPWAFISTLAAFILLLLTLLQTVYSMKK